MRIFRTAIRNSVLEGRSRKKMRKKIKEIGKLEIGGRVASAE